MTLNLKTLTAALKGLSTSGVYIGVPATKGKRKPSPGAKGAMTNAQLAYIHEFGSPINNVPERSFLRPGVKDSQKQWRGYLKQALSAALHGDEAAMNRAMNAAGIVAVAAVKKVIVNKIPPPIKPATMAARRRNRGPGKKKAMARAEYRQFHAAYETGAVGMDASSATPLVDTAQLLNSITYVVKK